MRRLACLAVMFAFVTTSLGAEVRATLRVSVTVVAACTQVSVDPLAFADYRAGGAAVDARTAIAVQCTDGTPYTVAIAGGAGGAQRAMTGAGGSLRYELFEDAGLTRPWSGASAVYTASGASASHPLHGRIPSGQIVPPGAYVDTLTVTVAF